MIDLLGCTLEPLQEDGDLILLRAVHPGPADGVVSSVLVVGPAGEHVSPATLARLEHESTLAAALDPGWAARPVGLDRYQGHAVLVLEDPGGEPLSRLLGKPMELGAFLRLAVGLMRAVGRLHAAGLIHRNLKPANVLVNQATGEAWLTGFGIASRLRRERQLPEPPEIIAGTLAYMAPEQTGRMNRSIDSRSDLYAVGVSLYEMLTGTLPFTASDPTELVHGHIACRPVPPGERLKEIPSAISAIIMKLLAKTAEDRYQTASGVESDLRRCLAGWDVQRRIDDFPLGERDTPDRLLIPEKLYGREREVETLVATFDRIVKSGAPELVLVSGYSGIGKSSVVNELQKALVPPRGLFASGKFDQYKRDIPYSTLGPAFQSLVRPLLGKSDSELTRWREALGEALGPNGRLMIDVVPELKLIIGDQPPVPELPLQDAQRRFHLVFRRFIGVFARPEHPLALFLDDLQWLDAATLDLLEDLLTRSEQQHFLLIGAYRDNEVSAAHLLTHKLEAIRNARAPVQEIRLAPLDGADVRQLVADALRCEPSHAAPLAELVHEKTGGNPFFVVQFLFALVDEGLLAFDHESARWSWNVGRIQAKGYTANVVDLMVAKLTRLPLVTQEALHQLACLGNIADLTTLALVRGTTEEEVHADLWEAVRLELVERLDGAYRFVHDRVQEAAYSLIPELLRPDAHLRIGRLLVARTPPENREEVIFEIVNQLNRGAPRITSQDEREQLAELNLIAGKRAKASSAYVSALTYLAAGAELLREDPWERRPELAFALELHSSDCEICTGALQAAEKRLEALATRPVGTVQRCAVAQRRVDLYTLGGAGERAVAVALECLRHVGIDWPAHPTEAEARGEYERIRSRLGDRAIEDLVDLPQMQDGEALATLNVLTSLSARALYTDENLHALSVSRAVNLCLEHGNSDAAPVTYAAMGLLAGARFGRYDEGYRFGKMGCDLLERRGLNPFGGRTYYLFANLIPWTRPFGEGIDPARRAFQMAKEHGDPAFAAHACRALTSIHLASGHPLDRVERDADHRMEFVRQFGLFLDRISALLALVRTLRGRTTKFGSLDDGRFTERSFEERITGQPSHAFPECHYWIRKLEARFFAGDYLSAIESAEKAETWYATSTELSLFPLEKAECHFYAGLSRAARCEPVGPDRYAKHREALGQNERELRALAANCPQNFEGRAVMVGAEIARIEGRPLEAMDLYERAIRSARANGFVHQEALANEIAARFYMARGFDTIAHAYLRNARYCYLQWGADGKVRQLDALYPYLRHDGPGPGPTSTIEAPVDSLDLATVLKVSQAISGEIVLEQLLDTLMRTALAHAGATRGLLLLPHGAEQRIAAEATTRGDTVSVRLREASVAAAALPESLVHYVVRTHESVILGDASVPNPFAADPYLRQQHARSLLCVPLLNQTKLIGVLYLENPLTSHVFTPTRSAVLTLLASQAAISLENARLYAERQQAEEAVRQTQAELAHMARLTTLGELTASIAHEINQPIGAVVNNASACVRWLAAQNLEEARQSAVRIIADGQRAADTITRIRALAQNAPAHKDWLDLNATIRDVLALARSEVYRHGVLVETQLAADVPRIRGDRIQLQQVLLNLLMNALEALSGGGDGPRVVVVRSAPEAASGVLVAVGDSGPGLDPQHLDRLFDAFYTTKPQGLGLGLAISRRIIEAHGGRLWATANVPQGAILQFTVPRGSEEEG